MLDSFQLLSKILMSTLRITQMLEPGPVTSDKGARIEALERAQAGTRADSEHGPPAKGRPQESKELNRCSVTVCLESLQNPNATVSSMIQHVVSDSLYKASAPERARLLLDRKTGLYIYAFTQSCLPQVTAL